MGPAKLFRKALDLSREVAFEQGLAQVAAASHQSAFRRAAGLLGLAVAANGDTGRSIRDLGERMIVLRTLEKEREAKLGSKILILQILGVLIFPAIYISLCGPSRMNLPVTRDAVYFFLFTAFAMGSLDGFMFGKWYRVPAKEPFCIGLAWWAMGLRGLPS